MVLVLSPLKDCRSYPLQRASLLTLSIFATQRHGATPSRTRHEESFRKFTPSRSQLHCARLVDGTSAEYRQCFRKISVVSPRRVGVPKNRGGWDEKFIYNSVVFKTKFMALYCQGNDARAKRERCQLL